jgi:3-hydroxyisobutyrate dehydrogenase
MAENKNIIGFIGTGVMGKSMAGHLIKTGYAVNLFTRTKSKAEELIAAGGVWCESPGELAKKSNIIITIVGFPKDVEEVYMGKDGILDNAGSDSIIIDMTTSSPQLAQKISELAKEKGIEALDAPVSGGDAGAREARLSIMVGGEKEAFEKVKSVFEVMGKNIVYQGEAGSGQHCKMANQIAIASGMLGVCEALAYAKQSGLDQNTVLKSIESGAAGSWSLSNLGPRMIKGNFDPGFFVKHFIKDMIIALESVESLGMNTPGLALARQRYEMLTEQVGADLGTHALYKLYE